MNAVGRTINTRFDLDKNYRNTREIMKLAAEFVSTNSEQNDPKSGLQIFDLTQTSHYDLAHLLRCWRRRLAKVNCKLRYAKFLLGKKRTQAF